MAKKRTINAKHNAKQPSQPRGKWIFLPNAITSLNLIFGFCAALLAVERARNPAGMGLERFDICCWLILWASVLDVLDGKIAKLTHSASAFGMRMDSFADATTFGLAPAVLMACSFLKPEALPWHLGWIACGIYFFGAVLRLALYNVVTHSASYGFVGLPSPGAAATTVSYFLVARSIAPPAWVSGVLVALVGLLMVSRIPYPGFKGHKNLELKVVTGIVMALLLLMIPFGPSKVIFFTMLSYDFLFGWMWVLLRPYWVPELKAAKRFS